MRLLEVVVDVDLAVDDLDPFSKAKALHAHGKLVGQHTAPQKDEPQERQLGGRCQQKINPLQVNCRPIQGAEAINKISSRSSGSLLGMSAEVSIAGGMIA